MRAIRYYLAAVAAFTIWGSLSVVLRPLSSYPSVDILCYRVFSCAILMLLIVALFMRQTWAWNVTQFRTQPYHRKKGTMLINLGGSLFLGANWFSFIYVVNHVSVKATSLAYLMCPILISLLTHFAAREKLTRFQWLWVAVGISGCLLVSYNDLTTVLFSLIIGFSYACYLVSQRRNVGFSKFIVLTVQLIIVALALLPFYYLYTGPLPVSLSFYFFIELIAVVYTILPLWLNLYALKGLNSSTVGMFLPINPILAFVLAAIVYHEPLNSWQLIAYGFIFLAIILANSHQFLRQDISSSSHK